jgi:hypothetical protein
MPLRRFKHNLNFSFKIPSPGDYAFLHNALSAYDWSFLYNEMSVNAVAADEIPL